MNNRSPWHSQFIIIGILSLFLFLLIFPFYYIIVISVMPLENYATKAYHLFPDGFTLDYYRLIFSNERLKHAIGVTLFVTFVGTFLNVVVSAAGSYVLTKRQLKWHKALNLMVVIPLLFSGGMIPLYLVVRGIGLTGSIWALILPFLCTPFNIILMQNFFHSIPVELEEAAFLDGAKEFTVFQKVVVPLSKPILAVMTLFYGVFHWNEFFWSGILVGSEKYPMMVILQNLIKRADMQMAVDLPGMVPVSLTSAIIVAMVIPIILISPFIQKYFIKGMVLGAVKT